MKTTTWPKSWLVETPGKKCPSCGERTGRHILWGMPSGDVAVVVVGAGPIGLATVMTAKLYTPARVIAIDVKAR